MSLKQVVDPESPREQTAVAQQLGWGPAFPRSQAFALGTHLARKAPAFLSGFFQMKRELRIQARSQAEAWETRGKLPHHPTGELALAAPDDSEETLLVVLCPGIIALPCAAFCHRTATTIKTQKLTDHLDGPRSLLSIKICTEMPMWRNGRRSGLKIRF